jgi:hypothetical protein
VIKSKKCRSSVTKVTDTVNEMMTMETSPLKQLKILPSLQIFQVLSLMINIFTARNSSLLNKLEDDVERLADVLWIFTASDYLNPAEKPEEIAIKSKMGAFQLILTIKFETKTINIFREDFLNKSGIIKYLDEVANYLQLIRLDTKNAVHVNSRNDYELFVQSTRYQAPLSEKFIRKSALFRFFDTSFTGIVKYLTMGGSTNDIDSSDSTTSGKSKTGAVTDFGSISDYEIWKIGGGRLISLMSDFLCGYDFPTILTKHTEEAILIPEIILTMFCTLLDCRDSADETIKLRDSVKMKLWALQDAFSDFRLRDMVICLLNRAMLSSYSEPFFNLVPLVLRLGSYMMSEGNKNAQNSFMKPVVIGGQSIGFASPVRHILRQCMDVYNSSQKEKRIDMKVLKIVNEVSFFCRAFCGGHNKEARLFLRNQITLGSRIDLVYDTCDMLDLLGKVLSETYIKYISVEYFIDKIAPTAWEEISQDKRKCIAWHDKTIGYFSVARLLHSIGCGLKCLKDMVQGPCYDNQLPALKAVELVMTMIEYCGVVDLSAMTKLSTKGFTGSSFRRIQLETGDPKLFLKVYSDEMRRSGNEKSDAILKDLNHDDTKRNHLFDGAVGIDIDLLHRISKEAEMNALQFTLALLEGTVDFVVTTINTQANFPVIFQNMNNDFIKSSKVSYSWSQSPYVNQRKESAVAYLSLVSTLYSATGSSSKALEDWISNSKRKGLDIEKFNASVEIIGSKGDIQQIYFTIPEYITNYWMYPEVQRVKDVIVFKNDRDSPEEKINDFRVNMDIILNVMARQRYLSLLLTPPVHAIFGGRPVAPSWVLFFIPRQRVLMLLICLFLNIYYAYITYRERFPGYPGFDTYFAYLFDHLNQQYILNNPPVAVQTFQLIYVVSWIHISLNASIYFRNLLNSNAADHLFTDSDIVLDGVKNKPNAFLKMGSTTFKLLYGIFLVFYAELWSLAIVGFSLCGLYVSQWFYVPCLLEIIPQFQIMKSLMDIIALNITKILFTILLAILILYFYAVIGIKNICYQYNFHRDLSYICSL